MQFLNSEKIAILIRIESGSSTQTLSSGSNKIEYNLTVLSDNFGENCIVA